MKRVVPLAGLVLVAVMGSPQPAYANLWDWLQEWSGPGPFHTGGSVLGTVCPGDGGVTRPYEPGSNTPCFFIDFRRFIPEKGDNFPTKVEVTAYDFGLTWEVRRPVEIGIGLGAIVATGNGKTATRLTVSAPRIAVKPVLLLGDLFGAAGYWDTHPRARRFASVLKWYARESVITGRLKAEDLGVSAERSSYNRTNEPVASAGFLIDIGELIRPQRP
jgi:hypothetical protein